MLKAIPLYLFLIGSLALLGYPQDKAEDRNPKEKQPKVVSIPDELKARYLEIQQARESARRIAQETPQWKDYVILLNQEQSMLLVIQGEIGIRPITDKCVPIYTKDGKRILSDGALVTSVNGILDHFECPVQDPKKP